MEDTNTTPSPVNLNVDINEDEAELQLLESIYQDSLVTESENHLSIAEGITLEAMIEVIGDACLEFTSEENIDIYAVPTNESMLFDNYIVVKLKHKDIVVSNSNGSHVNIEELITRFSIKFSSINDITHYSIFDFQGMRSITTNDHFNSNYGHSHLPSDGSKHFKPFCLGSGPLSTRFNHLREVESSLFVDDFYFSLTLIRTYLEWESLEGTPYRYLENIQSSSNSFSVDDNDFFPNYDITQGFVDFMRNIIKARNLFTIIGVGNVFKGQTVNNAYLSCSISNILENIEAQDGLGLIDDQMDVNNAKLMILESELIRYKDSMLSRIFIVFKGYNYGIYPYVVKVRSLILEYINKNLDEPFSNTSVVYQSESTFKGINIDILSSNENQSNTKESLLTLINELLSVDTLKLAKSSSSSKRIAREINNNIKKI